MGLPEKRPTDSIEDYEIRTQLEEIQEGAFGNPITLDATPTADTPLLEADQWGTESNILYLRKDDTILVFTPGSTITVT